MVSPQDPVVSRVAETVCSLQDCIQRAGGSVLSWNCLTEMTAADLILLLAPNGIRFAYYGCKDPHHDCSTHPLATD